MTTLDRYLLKQFIPIFIVGILFFVMLLELIDLFANLWKYLSYEAPIREILRVAWYYAPQCVSYALPIALLFAASYVFGDLYARNELIIVFANGIPLARLAAAFFAVGVLLSAGSFFFEDNIVIASVRAKKELSRTLLKQQRIGNEADIVVKSEEGRLVYSVDYYNAVDQTINGVIIVERDPEGFFMSVVQARRGKWNDSAWTFENAYEYRWGNASLIVNRYENTRVFTEGPDTFRRNSVEVEELKIMDAAAFINDLAQAGLPTSEALADYYRRYAFSITPFIVLLLSSAVGGRFRKNILLMSLLASLIASVIYYVVQMLSMMMAKLGYISPMLGAWVPAVLFILCGAILLSTART